MENESPVPENSPEASTPTIQRPQRTGQDTPDDIFEKVELTDVIDNDVLEAIRSTGKMDVIAPSRWGKTSTHVQGIDGGSNGRHPKDYKPPTESTDDTLLVPIIKRKPGRPLKTDLANARAAIYEKKEELHPDDVERIAVDLSDGKLALETALKKELSRRVKMKGSMSTPGQITYEYKFTRLVRKMVNLALSGDREMIKFVVERAAGKSPIAAKEDRPTSFAIVNQIPSYIPPTAEKDEKKEK